MFHITYFFEAEVKFEYNLGDNEKVEFKYVEYSTTKSLDSLLRYAGVCYIPGYFFEEVIGEVTSFEKAYFCNTLFQNIKTFQV